MILFLLGLAGAAPNGPGPDAMLRAGQYRLVTAGATQILAERPDDALAKSWLAQAQAGLQRCATVMPLVDELRTTPGWSAALATAEGRCALQAGEASRAAAAFSEAALLDPEHIRAWMGLAETAAVLEDSDLLAEALAGLEQQDIAPHAARIARSEIAQRHGLDLDTELALFERELTWARHRPTAPASLALADGLEWLRVGDASRAYDVLEAAISPRYSAPELSAWMGEAARRLGWAPRTEAIFATGRLARTPRVDVQLIRARWLIDTGETDEARALLDRTEGQLDPLWIATRWYLARSTDEDTTPWEQAWATVPSGYGELDQLVPIAP